MKYLITFIDNHSYFCHVYLLKSKDEVFSKFIEFQTRVEKKFGRSVKKIRNDRGGQYRSKKPEAYLKEHGIIVDTTTPYSPLSNEIVEKKTVYSLRW